jgi:hypothetical protein
VKGVNSVVVVVDENSVIVEVNVEVDAVVIGVNWVVVTVDDICVIVEVSVEVEVWLEVKVSVKVEVVGDVTEVV